MRRNELIQKMRPLLLKRRDALLQSLGGVFGGLATTGQTEVGDLVDEATETEYRNINAELTDVESRELEQIELALQRMREQTYGICMECDRTIPVARLQALPYASKCVNCQRQADRSPTPTGRDRRTGVSASASPRLEISGLNSATVIQ